MKKHFWIIVAIGIFATYPTSFAQTSQPDPKTFADWFTLSAALKAKGIDVTYVNWQAIEPLCLALKTQDSEIEYNKCRYEKAVWQHQFQLDNTTCNQQAISKLPNSLKFAPPAINTTIIGYDGRTKTIQNTVSPYSDSDLKNARNSFYMDCMVGYGWSSPNDWTAGKRQ